MTQFDVMVPHKNMTPERAAECKQIMITGNTAFRKWLPFITLLRSRVCRDAVIKGNLNKVLQYIPSERRAEFLADVPAILRVETVIEDVIGHHVKMIARLAKKWDARNRLHASVSQSYIDGGDIASEGFLAMFDAIRNYARADIRFLTYCWSTVNRRMLEAIVESAPVSCFSRREQKLVKTVVTKQLQSKSLDEAVQDGSVNDEDAALVREVESMGVVLASALKVKGEDSRSDYSCMRRGAASDMSGQPDGAWELYDFIERANLSEFEKDALLSSMAPSHGWTVECAARHTNKHTGQPMTRSGVGFALQNACNKIRRVAGLGEEKRNLSTLMSELVKGH